MKKSVPFVISCLVIFAASAFAAPSPKPKDEPSAIAVGGKDEDASTHQESEEPQLETKDIMPVPSTADDEALPSSPDKLEVHVKPREAAPANDAAKTKKSVAPKVTAKTKNTKKATAKTESKAKVETPLKAAEKAPEKKVEAETATPSEVSAEQSLTWLTNGNNRYVTKKFRADGRSASDRDRTAKIQKPHAIILSCSDSRVPPELIFDQGLGEITTIRVAGEVLDASVIASLEIAIQNEHPHLLVVLGHTQCESIETALSWKEKATYGSDALDRMVSEIKPHLKSASTTTPSPGLQVEAALQADAVARDLTERSEIIKKAVEGGALTIKTGLYWVDTGVVKFY